MYNNITDMNLYKKMYFILFNAITDSLELIDSDRPATAVDRLREAQQLVEDLFVCGYNL